MANTYKVVIPYEDQILDEYTRGNAVEEIGVIAEIVEIFNGILIFKNNSFDLIASFTDWKRFYKEN